MNTIYMGVYDGLSDWESGYVTAGLAEQRVVTAALTLDPVSTMGGLRILPDVLLSEVEPSGSAMLVLPGGEPWESGDSLAPFAAKAAAFLEAGVPVAAICGATLGLARAGLLDTRAHTSNAPFYLAMAEGYAGAERYVDSPAVTDGDLITAAAYAPVEFAREIFAKLEVYPPVVLDAWYRLFGKKDLSAWEVLSSA
ncbi:MAG: glutamine amidotransferase [Thermoactinospora sp.]|nr:glutamine amidotransferase [Thermoactinospora sp.]